MHPVDPDSPHLDDNDGTLAAGARVDRYVIERLLGAGAMGVVYAAHDPELDRRVAIKVLRPGTVAPAARERMAREARTLARLSRPDVVAVHDVGVHGDGVFIVMELVDGVTLRRWLADRPRGWRSIVDVMIRAGRGLAAAHAAGLVHRDFKPDNVLIANDGRVLVADFGLGTPAYMPPEQLAGEAGPAADQFAFCVTLYEAVYDRRPFAGRTPAEHHAAIVAGTLEPPATTRAPTRLVQIIARGLRAEPAARFPTMTALLDELARDPGRRARRLALGGVAIAGVVGATWVVAGGADHAVPCGGGAERAATVWNAEGRGALRAAFAREGRGQAATAAERTEAALDRYAHAWTAGYRDACEATHVRGDQSGELLDRRMACLDVRLEEVGALVGLFGKADAALVERAVAAVAALPDVAGCADADALDEIRPPADAAVREQVRTAQADLALARTLHSAGNYRTEEPVTRDIAARARTLGHPPLVAAALYELGRLEDALGHAPASLAAFGEARLAAETAGNDWLKAELAIAIANVAAAVLDRDEAARMDREAEATVARLGSPPRLAWLLPEGRARRAYAASDYAAALADFERALVIATPVFPRESYEIANLLDNIAVCHFALGSAEQALARHERVRAIRVAVLGPDHPSVADTLQNLANCHTARGRADEALPLYEEAIAILERSLGPSHPRLALPLHNLGFLYLVVGDAEASVRHTRRAYDVLVASVGADHPQTARTQSRLAVSLANLGQIAEAKTHATAAVATLIAKLGPDHVETGLALIASGDVHLTAGQPAIAADNFRAALAAVAGTVNEEYTRYGLGRSDLELGHAAAAAEQIALAITGAERLRGKDSPFVISYHVDLGRAHLAAERPDRAIGPLTRALALDEANGAATLPVIKGRIRIHLARALWSRPDQRDRAVALAAEARALLEPLEPAPSELAEAQRWQASHRRR